MSNTFDVAILGGGFSGAVTAARLVQKLGRTFRIAVFERSGQLGRGYAYGTCCLAHLLNVPAGKMSAFPESPEHFLAWLKQRQPAADAGTFAPRALYGEYLGEIFADAAAKAGDALTVLSEEVTNVRRERGHDLELTTAQGTYRARNVVLALGNLPPRDPCSVPNELLVSGRYIANPWAIGALDRLQPQLPLVLLGTGLTAVDVVLEARERGFKGEIILLSRRGFLPNRHAPSTPAPQRFAQGKEPASLKSLLAEFRLLLEDRAADDWRGLVDALRPATQALWRNLGVEDQKRFLRHLRPYWEVHRHRIAPEVAERIQHDLHSGLLRRISGRIVDISSHEANVAVRFRRRDHKREDELVAQRIINCTGPATGLDMACPPILRRMLEAGLCRLDPLQIGVEADQGYHLIDSSGAVHMNLFALGPLLKGQLWESTAVPELRVQAQVISEDLSRMLLQKKVA